MTLTFISANQVNPGRDGIDVVYSYTTSSTEEIRSIHVVGSDNSWHMTDQEKYIYAQHLFAGTISYIKRYWTRHKELPQGEIEIHDRRDFTTQPEQKTAWEGFTLDLD